MKVVLVTRYFGFGGGQANATVLLFKELARAGQDVSVIAIWKNWFSSNRVKALDCLAWMPQKLREIALIPGNPLVDSIMAAYLRRGIEEIEPDVIHIQDQFVLPASVQANKELQIPCIFTCNSNILVHRRGRESLRERISSTMFTLRNRTFAGCLKDVDIVISVSDYIKQELVSVGIESKKIRTVYNIPFPNIKAIEAEPSKEKKKPAAVILFAQGSLVWYKGFDVLLKAIRLVSEREPGIKLIIAGDGREMKNLAEFVNSNKLEPIVFFTGWVSQNEMMRLYQDSDIILLPSIFPEPFGRTSIEAMSFSKPIIASNVGGVSEAITDGINGILVPANNPQEIANAISVLAKNPKLREKMGKAGNEILKEKFGNEKLAGDTISLYEKVRK